MLKVYHNSNGIEKCTIIFTICAGNNTSEETRQQFALQLLKDNDVNHKGLKRDYRKVMPTYQALKADKAIIFGVDFEK